MGKRITVEVAMRKPSERAGRDGLGVKSKDGDWYHFINVDKLDFGNDAVVELGDTLKKGQTTLVKSWNVVKGGNASGGRPVGGAPGKAGPSGDYSEVNWNAATARAIEMADLLLKHDAIALGPKTAKPDDRKTVILSVVGELTAHFFKEIKDRTALKEAAAIEKDLDEGDEGAGESDDDSDDGDF